jgi:hypothetical protein
VRETHIFVFIEQTLHFLFAVCCQQIGPAVAEEVVELTQAQVYQRFTETVQHSLGNDVSWDHLSFLFYTTKGVVSAVGKGSKLAKEAKEMTLRYFSDKFAKWIMDQGGFVSVCCLG